MPAELLSGKLRDKDGEGAAVNYVDFIKDKSQWTHGDGFTPSSLPNFLFDFQKFLVEWSLLKGRSAIFADCGLGKTAMQLAWAEQVVRKTNKPVLILTPLAVARQTIQEAKKFGIEAEHSKDGLFGQDIVVANYDRLHYFDASDFSGVVCDESSILKNYGGETKKQVTRFLSKLRYRLLCTATAAPNDYTELGTSSEALGALNYSDMLKMFFRQFDGKGQKSEQKLQDEAERLIAADPNYFKKLSFRVSQSIGQWRLKHHAVKDFWRWVSSWAKACRKPSDIGFNDDGFILPGIETHDHVIKPNSPAPGYLFSVPAIGLAGEREERKRTIQQRCEYVAGLVDHADPAVVWCHFNAEGDLLEEAIPDGKQIAGSTSDDRKIELYDAFASGELRVLIIKPKIGAWGLNWQHCNRIAAFPTHSYEQYYQSIRRCYRFGQERTVRVDVVATEGEVRVLGNMRRKAEKADIMFDALIAEMNNATKVEIDNLCTTKTEPPVWL